MVKMVGLCIVVCSMWFGGTGSLRKARLPLYQIEIPGIQAMGRRELDYLYRFD